jgi:hypothetical protein
MMFPKTLISVLRVKRESVPDAADEYLRLRRCRQGGPIS